MSRLEKKFEELKSLNKTGLVVYLTAGMPDADGTIKAVKLAEGVRRINPAACLRRVAEMSCAWYNSRAAALPPGRRSTEMAWRPVFTRKHRL